MTIVHKDGNIHKTMDGPSILTLPNEIENPAYVPEQDSPQILIEGISATDLNTTFMIWNPSLPQDFLRKDLAEVHPTAASFKGILEKARNHSVRCMKDSFAYAKDKWDKSHATPGFKVGDLVLVSTININNSKVFKKLKDPLKERSFIKALHGENSVEVELSEELRNKHCTFQVSLFKTYKSGDYEKFPLMN
ncbi:hypothetical protein O181_056214 [Austropuccinia psidii MF-1]|uniref:Uncharacterized protein n=1 Tax=Austropuccinia psidii MF-1 TaxID=1389203 RepID=A0A9Q3E853_9BASI|nr:hypothetical protein [Austropuccinia psidii MF-1]